MYFNKVASFTVAVAISSMLAQAAPAIDSIDMETREFQNELEARWGSGKFKVDDDTYHRQLKPAIIQKMKEHDPKFASKCGSNPDFMVDRSGDVYPEPQAKNAKACPKSKFTLNLASLIESYQPKRSPSPAPSSHSSHSSHRRELYEDLDARDFDGEVLEIRWGSGKFKVDDDTYHRQLKPAIIQKMKEHDPKFASKCGSNPDFMVDRAGDVYPEPQAKNAKACPKSKFTLNLASLIQSYQARSRSPSPHRRELYDIEEVDARDFYDFEDFDARDFDEELLEARWGSGKFKVDDDTYHRQLKPAIIREMKAHDSKFASKCGSNPDFMVDKSGNVYPEPQAKNAKACPKSKFTLNLASLIESYQPKRSPSPAPSSHSSHSSHRRELYDIDEVEARDFDDFDFEAREFDLFEDWE